MTSKQYVIWLSVVILIRHGIQFLRASNYASSHLDLAVTGTEYDGSITCDNFCFEGANGNAIPRSICKEVFIGAQKFHCDYKRRPDQDLSTLPPMTCFCRDPVSYEMTFDSNKIRERKPPREMVLNVVDWNYQYVTLDFEDYRADLVNTSFCQNQYYHPPDGWIVAPADQVTLEVIEQFAFSGAHFIILSDRNVYRTKLGRSEKFKHAEHNTLWEEIEGRVVEGNNIDGDNSTEYTLEQCQKLCIDNTLCKAVEYPRSKEGSNRGCQLKSSTDTNRLDQSYTLSTYIKLTNDTAAGIPLKGNPDGLFADYYEPGKGLKVPEAYCPGRILLRKERKVQQCADNGHWYELVHWDPVTYDEAKLQRSLYWRGAKGHLAVITSPEEQQCIEKLICGEKIDGIESNIAWVGAEKVGAEYKWMVNGTEEYGATFIDSTGSAALGMYTPEIAKWESYQSIYKETANSPSDFYAVTVCHPDDINWNITRKSEPHFIVIEYELPIDCDGADSVFEILGPPMEYYNAETTAKDQDWFGEQGYLATIITEEEEKCVERLGFCGIEKVWAAGSDNMENHKPHEWLWKSTYGPYSEIDRLFYVQNRPNDKRLGLYANWDIAYEEPDNLLGEQHYLTVCGGSNHSKTWTDENRHSRFQYLIEYNQTNPMTPPRVRSMTAIDGGVYVVFSIPLQDGGSPIIACRVAIHPIPLFSCHWSFDPEFNSLNFIAYSIDVEVHPTSRHFETESVFFNAINAVTYESEIRCANKHGVSPTATPQMATPVGEPEKPLKTWIVEQLEDGIIVAWERPFSDSGSAILRYHIRSIAIGRRGANCEKQCAQEFNENTPPPDYTKMRPEHWNQYFRGMITKEQDKVTSYLEGNSTFEESIAENEDPTSEVASFIDDLADIESTQEDQVDLALNETIRTTEEGTDFVDLDEALEALMNHTDITCTHIGFGTFTQPDAKPQDTVCDPYCKLIQEPGCEFTVYRGDTLEVIMSGNVEGRKLIIPDDTMIGTYYSPDGDVEDIDETDSGGEPDEDEVEQLGTDSSSDIENVERIEWTEDMVEWVALPRGLSFDMKRC